MKRVNFTCDNKTCGKPLEPNEMRTVGLQPYGGNFRNKQLLDIHLCWAHFLEFEDSYNLSSNGKIKQNLFARGEPLSGRDL